VDLEVWEAGAPQRAKHGRRIPILLMPVDEWRKAMTPSARMHLLLVFSSHCFNLNRLATALWIGLLARQHGNTCFQLTELALYTKASKGRITGAIRELSDRQFIVNLGTPRRRILGVMPHPEYWNWDRPNPRRSKPPITGLTTK
jgi:hypothetical protein